MDRTGAHPVKRSKPGSERQRCGCIFSHIDSKDNVYTNANMGKEREKTCL
jgi:hypothetical protein